MFDNLTPLERLVVPQLYNLDRPSLQNNYVIRKHRNLSERCAAAKLLQSHSPLCSVVVDNMMDCANIAYAATPERLYIIRNNVITFEGGIGPMLYNVGEVRTWLEQFATGRRSSRG